MTVSIPSRLHALGRSRVVLLALVALCARAVTFGNPIVQVDEEFYYVVARAMAHGALPYIDVWDRKPFGLFLIYLPAGLFAPPVGIWVYQAMAFAAVVATAMLIARLAERAGWARGALPAAMFYILWLNMADGQGGQAPVFYNLSMVGAATLACLGSPARRRRRGAAAMALVGLSLQVKYSVVFEGLWFGLWLLWNEWRARRSAVTLLAYALLLIAVTLAPTLLVAGGYAAIGQEQAYLYANFLSIFARHPDPLSESLGNIVAAIGLVAPFLILAAAGRHGKAETQTDRERQLFLRCWFGASLFGLAVFGSWFNHYTLPVMVPGTCCIAGFLGDRPRGRALVVPLLIVAFLAGQGILWSQRRVRGTRAQFAELVQAIGPRTAREPGSLYVYSGSPMLYAMTGRAPLSRYLFATHLMLEREHGAIGVEQGDEIDRIFDRHPDVVVVQSFDGGERGASRAVATRRLAHDGYRRSARTVLGNKFFDVYRRAGK